MDLSFAYALLKNFLVFRHRDSLIWQVLDSANVLQFLQKIVSSNDVRFYFWYRILKVKVIYKLIENLDK